MPERVPFSADLKTAAVLSGCAGLLAAVTVPLLLPSVFEQIPAEQRTLPLPLPVFCLALALQVFVAYGFLAFAGLRMARARDLEPAPLLTGIWLHRPPKRVAARAAPAFATGLLCGVFLAGAIALIRRFLPHTLPQTMHPSSVWAALMASATASFGE